MTNCIYWNCGSGIVKKLSCIHDLLDNVKPLICFISECDILASKTLGIFSHEGYNLALSNTLTSVGKSRLLAWFDPNEFERMQGFELPGNEVIVLKSLITNLIVVGCYRPFKLFPGETTLSNFNRLMENFELILNSFTNVVIVGDLNVNMNDQAQNVFKSRLELLAERFMLFQLIEQNTRQRVVAGTLQQSLLDIVYTSVHGLSVDLLYNHKSDHLQLHVSLPITVRPRGNKTFSFTDWSHYSAHAIRTLYLELFRGINIHVRDPNLINNSITSAICGALNLIVPKRQVTIRNSSQVFSPRIINLRNQKARAFKRWTRLRTRETLEKLKEISSALTHESKKLKQEKVNASLTGDNKKFWSTVSQMMGNKITKQDSFFHETNEVVDPLVISNLFNDYFGNKVTQLTLNSACENFIIPNLRGSEDDENNYINAEELVTAISQLKSSKAQGFDEVPSKVLKHLSPVIIDHLLFLFNSIIHTGIIPKAWKISRIVPIHKKGDRKLIANFRPVSNISSLSKIFERCLVNKLKRVDSDLLFGCNQHAYRSGSSTTTACLTIQDFISCSLDKKEVVLLNSIDLTSAFDLLRPFLLVKNLLDLKISKQLILVILNFLTGRTGFVDFNGHNSNLKKIPLGCVQGSVLGPILFNIYVRELQSIVGENCFCVSYADDSYIAISSSLPNLNASINQLNQIASNHIEWLTRIGMICNTSKTEFVAFGYDGPPLSLTVGDDVIQSSSKIKILGINFTSNLTWKAHAHETIRKCNRLSYMLRYLATFLTKEQHRRVLHSHFFSIMYYCSPVWASCLSYQDTRRFNTLVMKIIRLNCHDFSNIFSNGELCEMSNLRSFNSVRTLNDAKMLHFLCTNTSNTLQTTRLMIHSISFSRFPNKLSFIDDSSRRIGRTSFVNRSKKISESIPFEWWPMGHITFNRTLKSITPLYLP